MLQAIAAGVAAGALAFTPVHLHANLVGPRHVSGHAEYQNEVGHGRRLDLELHHLAPGEHVTVYLHHVRVGGLVANRHGVADRDLATTVGCRAGQQIRVWHNHHLVAAGTFGRAHHHHADLHHHGDHHPDRS